MLRSILAVLAGYITMMLGVTSTLAILFFVARDAFPDPPGPYTGPAWVLWVELVLGFVVAIGGGYVCGIVARRRELAHGLVLAGLALVLGIASAGAEAGLKPMWSSIGLALAGAIGVALGSAWRARHRAMLGSR